MTTIELILGIIFGIIIITFCAGMLYVDLKYDREPKEDTK